MTSRDVIVTMPPDVVRIRASSTVFVKASSRVNLDFTGMSEQLRKQKETTTAHPLPRNYEFVRTISCCVEEFFESIE